MNTHTIPAKAIKITRSTVPLPLQLEIDPVHVALDRLNLLPGLLVGSRDGSLDFPVIPIDEGSDIPEGFLTEAADVTLERFRGTGITLANPTATFGRLTLPSGMTLVTVEDAWRDNQRNVSCIPVGTYHCAPRRFNRGNYDAIEITNVPGRTHILIHKGNTDDDLNGCIAPGMRFGWVQNQFAVVNSAAAFAHVMGELGGKEFTLKITDIL